MATLANLKALERHHQHWLFSGDDALMPYFAQAGAKGLVSLSNAWPSQTHEFVKRSLSGQYPNLFTDLLQAIQSLFAVETQSRKSIDAPAR